eukprot:622896-Pyramimonas_sp.AAC.1
MSSGSCIPTRSSQVGRILEAFGDETLGQDREWYPEQGLETVEQFADDSDLDSHASDMEGWDEAVGDARGDSDGEGEQQAAAAAEGGG